jgi:alpha-L-rhamnosidase
VTDGPHPGPGAVRADVGGGDPFGHGDVPLREWTVTVPAGTTAEVLLPGGRTATAGPGTHTWQPG